MTTPGAGFIPRTGVSPDPDVKASGLIVLAAVGVLCTLRLLFRKIAD